MSDSRRWGILIEPTADGGHGAWASDIPGCFALGGTASEAVIEMPEW